jgi:glutamine synthetase
LGSELPQAAAVPFLQGNPGHRPIAGAERLAGPPADSTADIRAEIASMLASLGFTGIRHGHGAAPMQASFAFAGAGLVTTGDRLQIFKDVVHHVAASYGKTATFMPKPLADHGGAGLSIQQSLWQGDRPVFAGQGYADLSQHALAFIAGVLQHGRALNPFTNPSTNSYRRLRRGQEEPVLLAYAAYNRSAAVRIPFARHASCKAVEVRFPDPLANPYLAFTAVLMAGLDGIAAGREPGDAMDRNLYDLPGHEREELPAVAGSLEQALDALAADRDFLARGDVVAGELVDAYVAVKRAEIERVASAPHPREFELYFGA